MQSYHHRIAATSVRALEPAASDSGMEFSDTPAASSSILIVERQQRIRRSWTSWNPIRLKLRLRLVSRYCGSDWRQRRPAELHMRCQQEGSEMTKVAGELHKFK